MKREREWEGRSGGKKQHAPKKEKRNEKAEQRRQMTLAFPSCVDPSLCVQEGGSTGEKGPGPYACVLLFAGDVLSRAVPKEEESPEES